MSANKQHKNQVLFVSFCHVLVPPSRMCFVCGMLLCWRIHTICDVHYGCLMVVVMVALVVAVAVAAVSSSAVAASVEAEVAVDVVVVAGMVVIVW